MSKISGLCAFVGVGWALLSACGSDAAAPPSTTFGGGGGTGGIDLDGAFGGSGGLIDAQLSDTIDLDSGCGLISEKANTTPLHLYIMMDKSSSMNGTKWDAAKLGLQTFVNDAQSGGIYVGLKFFPRPPDTQLCDQPPYAIPDTTFDLLPGNANAIIQALAAESPDGLSTPTYPALGGGILKSIEIEQNNPGHTAAVLLVTDGVPQGPAALCGGVNPEDTQVIADLAATGKNFNPPVLTYVIGLPGVDQSFANAVAAAGGTQAAILVSNTNVQQEFADALAKVRGQALPCEFEIPDKVEKGEIDYGHVNVLVTTNGSTDTIGQSDPGCSQGAGWHYDDAANPKSIILCPAVCDAVKKDFKAEVNIVLGCETVKNPVSQWGTATVRQRSRSQPSGGRKRSRPAARP